MGTVISPSAKFAGDEIVSNGDQVSEVIGTLTLHENALPVTLKANNINCFEQPMLKRELCGGDFEGEFGRGDFRDSFGLPIVANQVRLKMQVEGIRR